MLTLSDDKSTNTHSNRRVQIDRELNHTLVNSKYTQHGIGLTVKTSTQDIRD